MTAATEVSRRDFLKAGVVAGGLVLAVRLPITPRMFPEFTHAGTPLAPNVFVQVGSDGVVTIWVSRSEMGQGVRTALPMILADELEADWSTIRIEQADSDPKYGDQGTGGSDSVSSMWAPLRKAGAQAREMLVAAGARRWGVAPESCRAEKGTVIHVPTGRQLNYGALASEAAALPVPENPRLKGPTEFRLIGTSAPRLDTPSKVDGSAGYGLDVRVAGMLYATLARCPVIGGTMQGYDPAAAKAIPGVRDVVPVSNGVAVIAENTWAAIQGRRVLECRWDEGPASRLDSETISRMMRDRARLAGALARNDGDPRAALRRAARVVEAEYEVPFLAHAPMEPMNCVADVRVDRCEIWAPTQVPGSAVMEVAARLKLAPEKVTLHVTLLGGGFGRRLLSDYVVEAAEVSRAANAPVKLAWSREDDIQHGWFRPVSFHRLSGGLDAKGRPLVWTHRIVAPSIVGQRRPQAIRNGFDSQAVEGAANIPYGFPNLLVDYCLLSTPVPVSWWRSVYTSQNVFANECFMDELAHAAGKDPVAFRRELLSDAPRERAVLDLAAAKAGWGSPLPRGRGRGIALHHFWSDAIVAEVAEVSVKPGEGVRVHRVVCAVDCGTAVNPDGVAAQIESGVVYGLSAALKGAITIKAGRVEQSNFHDYPVLRIGEMPVIETYLVPSTEAPMGVGEPGTPPIAPAVANALFAATGTRVRKLPIRA